MPELHLPAGLLMQSQPEYTPEQIAHIERWQQAVAEFEQGARRDVLRFAPVLCTCRQRYIWHGPDQSPPQDGCIIHHSVMMTSDGREMIG